MFNAEGVVLKIYEDICRLMEQKDISKTELARRLGVSRPFINKLFQANPGVSVLTLVKLAQALGVRLKISFSS